MLGKRFSRLICIERTGTDIHGAPLFKCKCDCGTIKIIRGRNLRTGQIKSCGCLSKELSSKRMSKRLYKHGKAKSRPSLYTVWVSMKQRCFNQKTKNFYNYGGRGISVSKEWEDYKIFEEWSFLNGYKEGLQIDRINNDGNYEPSNCRWVTCKVNSRNKRTNRKIKGKTITEWSEQSNIKLTTLKARLDSGSSIEEAIRKPVRGYNRAKIEKEVP